MAFTMTHQTARKAIRNTICAASAVALIITMFAFPKHNAYADDLEEAAAQVEAAQAAYDSATAKQEELASQIEELSAQISEIESALPEQEAKANAVIRSMYREQSPISMLAEAFLTTETFGDFLRYVDYYNKLADYQTETVASAKQMRDQLADDLSASEQAKAEQDQAVEEAEQAKKDAQAAYNKARGAASIRVTSGSGGNGEWNSGFMTLSQMKFQGVVYANGYRYTYYSESVLPGNGLSIPGRHHANGCVVDGDGYICVASSDLARGTVVPTPLGDGKVYDCGCASGTIDLYIA